MESSSPISSASGTHSKVDPYRAAVNSFRPVIFHAGPPRSRSASKGRRLVWFVLLYAIIVALEMLAVSIGFGASDAGWFKAACHRTARAIDAVLLGVFQPVRDWFPSAEVAPWIIFFIWAVVLYFVSAMLGRPRWAFRKRTS